MYDLKLIEAEPAATVRWRIEDGLDRVGARLRWGRKRGRRPRAQPRRNRRVSSALTTALRTCSRRNSGVLRPGTTERQSTQDLRYLQEQMPVFVRVPQLAVFA